jgi:hypothetical protein
MSQPQITQPKRQYWLQRAVETRELGLMTDYPDMRQVLLRLASTFEEVARQLQADCSGDPAALSRPSPRCAVFQLPVRSAAPICGRISQALPSS